jgi:putative oxidoreductase
MQFPALADFAEWGVLAIRVVIGIIFIVHGWPKITGGKNMAEAMTGSPNPTMAAIFTIQGLVEVAGGLLIALGIITQIAAIPLAIIMLGAIYLKMTRFNTGFYSQSTTGWEFDLLILAGLLLLFLAGPGELAIQS